VLFIYSLRLIYKHVEHHYFPSSSGFRSHPPPQARIYKLRERLEQSIGYSEADLRNDAGKSKYIDFDVLDEDEKIKLTKSTKYANTCEL
jgi:hypothetical protein